MAIGTATALLASAAIGAGSSILGAKSAAKANDQNAQIAQQTAADNNALTREIQARNAGLVTDQQGANTDLLTQARDFTSGIFNQAQGQNAALNQNTFTGNQGVIDGNTRAISDTLAQARNQNTGIVNQNVAANEADIRSYGDRAAGAYQPFVNNGQAASNAINALLGIGGDAAAQSQAFKNWADSTGFQFTLDSGARSVSSNQAAQGMLNSGATLKALQDRGQQTAQTYFGNYLNALNGQAGQGISAAGGLSSALQNTSSALTGNRNFGTNALLGVNDTYASGMGNNIKNYMTATLGNSTDLRNAQTGNTDRYSGLNAGAYADWANGIANLNTSATNALIGGNNAALGSFTANNNNMANALTSVNNDRAANANNLYGNISDIAQGTAGNYAANQFYNQLLNGGGNNRLMGVTTATNPLSVQSYGNLTPYTPQTLPAMTLARI